MGSSSFLLSVAAVTSCFLFTGFSCLISSASSTADSKNNNFVRCMMSNSPHSKIYTPNTISYSSILESSIQNLRFISRTVPKPLTILTPFNESEIIAGLGCSKKQGLQIRVRSGGHDYEGLSSVSDTPFIIIDLVNFRSIHVDVKDETAWVQSGSTLGEVYYRIAEKSNTLAFPAGICPTVGVGGQFSGGGLGTMVRKYGLAADNIVDAQLLDINGRILDRQSMGEDLFWAIRGGGGMSFGIVLSWKLKLVHVPPKVTVFTVHRTLEQGATKIVNKWQKIADKLHEDLFIRIIIQILNSATKTVEILFNSLYLGETEELLQLMTKSFPELGLTAEECIEMTWIQSVLYSANYQNGEPVEVLMNRTSQFKTFFKAKTDFLQEPIPETALEGVWKRILQEEEVYVIIEPLGGIMDNISASNIPFPHRKGNLYNIQYLVKWKKRGTRESEKHMNWIRELYRYMSPYVSSAPRGAYINYRDLDIGRNDIDSISYSKSSAWGKKYLKNNFKRLAMIKGNVDPENYFSNEQSIPPLLT